MSRQKPGVNPAVIIFIIISLLLIIGLIQNAIGLYQSRNRLETKKTTVSELESLKQTVTTNISLQANPGADDQIIRNQLNLALPGETIVIIGGTDSSLASPASPLVQTPEPPASPLIHWLRLLHFIDNP